MIHSLLLAACLIAGNHYVWTGWDSRWNDANNWGAMDYPQAGDDITVGRTWGTGWEPIHTIGISQDQYVQDIYVWDNYETMFSGYDLTARNICGSGSLTISCDLTCSSMIINSLTITPPVTAPMNVPEPSVWLLLITGLFCYGFCRKR